MLTIQPFRPEDRAAVIELWARCGLSRPNNDPGKDIDRKMKVRGDLFLIGWAEGKLVASAMVGYEGHRGWINYLAVSPDRQGQGFGRQMLDEAERLLRLDGCAKINLQVRTGNQKAAEFYRALGWVQDDLVCFGKRLESDEPKP